jgi:septal ring factor EnvC (AmiA/AmiB activator)
VRTLIVWFFFVATLLYGASTLDKIKDSKKDLNIASTQKEEASRKIEKIADDIKKSEKEISALEKKIDLLKVEQERTQKEFIQLKSELKDSDEALAKINTTIDKKREKFLSLATEQFSVIFAMQQFKTPTQKSIISYEVYKAYKKHNTQELQSLKKEIISLQDAQKEKRAKRDKTKASLDKIIKTREEYAEKKEAKEKFVKQLAADEEKYQKKLHQIVDKQNQLRDTLAKLDILHKKEVEEARKAAEARKEAIRLEKERARKLRLAKEKARKAKLALQQAKTEEAKAAARQAAKEAEADEKRVQEQSETVRKVHSSYQKPKLYAYRGRKTISPIKGAKVIKKFGTYVDPVYKIKIYNESITLQAPHTDAKVQNVLNGKIVYAGKSSMLGKVVVVAHSGKMHTVYAGLSKIAPNIKKGRKIKKGYVVGKVNSKLVFQATKDSKHINPLRLISI